MTVNQILARIRHHAALAPLDRLDTDPSKIVAELLRDMRSADRFAECYVAEVLDTLRPRLYDLWDAAASVREAPAWLAPLAKYGAIYSAPIETPEYEAQAALSLAFEPNGGSA
jgi:hypothetical protein